MGNSIPSVMRRTFGDLLLTYIDTGHLWGVTSTPRRTSVLSRKVVSGLCTEGDDRDGERIIHKNPFNT